MPCAYSRYPARVFQWKNRHTCVSLLISGTYHQLLSTSLNWWLTDFVLIQLQLHLKECFSDVQPGVTEMAKKKPLKTSLSSERVEQNCYQSLGFAPFCSQPRNRYETATVFDKTLHPQTILKITFINYLWLHTSNLICVSAAAPSRLLADTCLVSPSSSAWLLCSCTSLRTQYNLWAEFQL